MSNLDKYLLSDNEIDFAAFGLEPGDKRRKAIAKAQVEKMAKMLEESGIRGYLGDDLIFFICAEGKTEKSGFVLRREGKKEDAEGMGHPGTLVWIPDEEN